MSDENNEKETPRDTFYEDIKIPFNADWESNGYEFVNAVDVADTFIRATAYAVNLGETAERLSDRLSELERQKSQKERAVFRLRRDVLSENYNKITKSAGPEIQNAFIVSVANEAQKKELAALETEIDALDDKIGVGKPMLERVRNRMKLLEKNMDWAKQFLDFDKLLKKLEQGNRV